MKRFKYLIFAVLIIAAIFTMGFKPNEFMGYSSTQTGDALIHTGTGWLYGIMVKTDGTNSVTIQFKDGLNGTADQFLPDIICQTSATNRLCVFGTGDIPIPFNTGLYVDITSSDATPDYTVFYRGQ